MGHYRSPATTDKTSSDDFYALLGIGREATTAEVRKAFHRVALTAHPDKGGDPGKFEHINHAYATLSDSKARARYDLSGQSGPLTVDQEFRANFFASKPDDEYAGMTVMEERRAREKKRLAAEAWRPPDANDNLTEADRVVAEVMAEEAARVKREQLAGKQPATLASQALRTKTVSMPVPTASNPMPKAPASFAPSVNAAAPAGDTTSGPTLAEFLGQARPEWLAKDLQSVQEKLARIEIVDVAGLLAALRATGEANLNARLRQAGKKAFAEATMQALREHAKVYEKRESAAPPIR